MNSAQRQIVAIIICATILLPKEFLFVATIIATRINKINDYLIVARMISPKKKYKKSLLGIEV